MNSSKTGFYKLISLLVLIIIVYVLFDRVLPGYGITLELFSDYRQSKAKLEDDLNWKDQHIQLKRDVNRLQVKLSEKNLEIPEKGMISRPLSVIDSLLNQNKCKLNQLQIVKIDSTQQYQIIISTIGLGGEFDNIKKFVKDVETSPLIMNIKAMNVKLESLYSRNLSCVLNVEILFKN